MTLFYLDFIGQSLIGFSFFTLMTHISINECLHIFACALFRYLLHLYIIYLEVNSMSFIWLTNVPFTPIFSQF